MADKANDEKEIEMNTHQDHPHDDDEVFNVPVPRAALPKVTAVLHQYYTERMASQTEKLLAAAGTTVDDDDSVDIPGQGTWTREEVTELFHSYPSSTGRRIIDQIAVRSLENTVASYGELMDVAEIDEYQLRSHFGAFSKKGKQLKGTKEGAWPMEVFDAGSKAPKGNRYTYRMPRPVARWWLGLSGGAA